MVRVEVRGEVREMEVWVSVVEQRLDNPVKQPGLGRTEQTRVERVDDPFQTRVVLVASRGR